MEAELGRRDVELRARGEEIVRLAAEREDLRAQLEGRDRQVIELLAELRATRERVEAGVRELTILARRLEEMELAREEGDGSPRATGRRSHPGEPPLEPLPSGQLAGRAARSIRVDVGPFEDFSQLVRFEDAANSIGETGDISIRRFSGGRARIDVALREPVDLLRELEERCDIEFVVRSQSESEIVLDVEPD